MKLTSHDKKHLKRLTRELLYWRRKLIKGLQYVNFHRFSEDRAKEMQAEADRDVEVIGYIDILLMVICELNDVSYDVQDVPVVKARVIEEVKETEVE